MKAAVIVFPGSNCDRDCKVAVERSTGARSTWSGTATTDLPDGLDLIVLPGGFSYGDYLRCGAMAALSPVMQAVVKAAAERGVAGASASATASRSCARPACCPAPCCATRS